jgi:hemerythrin-like domain-containing protein
MPVQLGSRPEHGFDQPLGLLSDCHRRIERFLEMLQRVAAQGATSALNDEQRRAVDAALEYFRTAAPRHTADEEESLFPMLRAAGPADAKAALQIVDSLEQDHAAANLAHAEVDRLFGEWIGQGGLNEPHANKLSLLLRELREMYRHHIAVEDNDLFPLAARLLGPEQLKELGRQMAHRRGLDPRP